MAGILGAKRPCRSCEGELENRPGAAAPPGPRPPRRIVGAADAPLLNLFFGVALRDSYAFHPNERPAKEPPYSPAKSGGSRLAMPSSMR